MRTRTRPKPLPGAEAALASNGEPGAESMAGAPRLQALAPVAVLLLAFHDSWRWLVARTWVTPEEAITLAATVVVIVAAVARRIARGHALAVPPLWPLTAALALWAGLVAAGAPRIITASMAVTTTLATLWHGGYGRRPPAAFLALASLVLPWVPTLQFYLGYPMRVVCSAMTVPLLWLAGRPVGLDGTALVWQGMRIEFDAPCSGVAMAWAASLLVLAVATLSELDWWRTLRLVLTGLKLVAIANVLRAAALFHLETGLVAVPLETETMHQLVGVAAFAAAATGIAMTMRRAVPWHQ